VNAGCYRIVRGKWSKPLGVNAGGHAPAAPPRGPLERLARTYQRQVYEELVDDTGELKAERIRQRKAIANLRARG
jgi:hypothetical protein